MPYLDSVRGANVNRPLVDLAHLGAADDVGNDGKDDFVFGGVLRGLPEEILEDWNLRQAGNSAELPGLLVFHDSAEQAGLAVFQADLMLDFALADDGLADAADVGLAGDGRNVHRDL